MQSYSLRKIEHYVPILAIVQKKNLARVRSMIESQSSPVEPRGV